MLRVIQVGLGALGRHMVRLAAERPDLRVVAAVDPAPDLVGRDLAELCEVAPAHRAALGTSTGPVAGRVTVQVSLAQALSEAAAAAAMGQTADVRVADVAIVTTFSDLQRVRHQIAEVAGAGVPVVSTCEELSYPWRTHGDEARSLDEVCRAHGVACLGTGVNPGFLMDYLPSVLTGLCTRVERVTVRRVQEAASRRIPFQEKIGEGLSVAEFEDRVAQGSLGHVGIAESVSMMAAACGWRLAGVEVSIAPVVAERDMEGAHRSVAAGHVAGVEQWGRGSVDDGEHGRREAVTLHFRAAVGQEDPRDEIEIEGTPPVHVVIPGGVNGDAATCGVTLNALAVVATASPGLHTMLDLPVPTVGRG